jgi:hypothetical protein
VNLLDTIALLPPSPAAPTNERAEDLAVRLEAVAALRQEFTKDERPPKFMTEARLEFDRLRAGHLFQHGSLPASLEKGFTPDSFMRVEDGLALAAQSPRTALAEVRAIADAIGFLIMPFVTLDTKVVEQADPQTRTAVRDFDRILRTWCDIYVLAPVEFYSVEQHARADVDGDVYAPPQIEQAFMAINMVLPMFRTMLAELRAVNKRLDQAEKELQNLAKRVSALERAVEQQRREAAARAAARVSDLTMRDPMMLAVPKGQDIRTAPWALVGPCWGPDFDEVLAAALGRQKVLGQRAHVEAEHKRLWNLRVEFLPDAKPKAKKAKKEKTESTLTETQIPCPECTGHLVERRNNSNGSTFLGCSRFPSCRFTSPAVAASFRHPRLDWFSR